LTGTEEFSAQVLATPRQFMGQAFNAADPGQALQITRLEFYAVYDGSIAGVNFTERAVRVQFWNTSNNANSGSSLVFSDPAGGVRTTLLGAYTVPTPDPGFTSIKRLTSIGFSTPVSLSSLTNLGVTINLQGDNGDGNGLRNSNTLSTAVRALAVPLVGSIPAFTADPRNNTGYYRNATRPLASYNSDFNFVGSDLRDAGGADPASGANSALAIRLYALAPAVTIPEASTLAMLAPGLLFAAGAIVRRRRAT
jgi:hypothetical protein